MKPVSEAVSTATTLRYAVLAILAFGSLVFLFLLEPIAQNPDYHAFADSRTFSNIPNFFDVLSNLPFLFVGALGLRLCFTRPPECAHSAWVVLFAGVVLVSFGSAFYHLNPNNDTLFWDRLPMTIGFTGLLTAMVAEHIDRRLCRWLLWPLVLFGIASVFYWKRTGDLRPYAWVQFVPMLIVPALMLLFRSSYTHRWLLLVAGAGYAIAKLTEVYDREIFHRSGGTVSGHTIKHLLAAAACYCILLMLAKRQAVTKQV